MCEDVILLSINSTYKEKMSDKELYEVTNFAWAIDENKRLTNSIKYAFAIYKNEVKEIYEIDKWVPAIEQIPTTRELPKNSKHKNKFAFIGKISSNNIRDKIINQKAFVRLYSGKGYGCFEEAKKFYNLSVDSFFNDIKSIINIDTPLTTEKENLIKSRVGQGDFREKLIKYWKGCSITNFKNIEILIASHIKPWSSSTNEERLDVYNGLLLIPNLDKLFDKGFISFDDSGKILISRSLKDYYTLGVNRDMNINIEEKHKKYLSFHREQVFKNT